MPKGYEAYSGLTVIALFYLVKTIIQGLGVGAEPKFFGAKNDRECGLLSFMCGNLMSLRWFLMMGFVVLGMFLIREIFPDQAVLANAATLIKEHVGAIDQSRWAALISEIMNHPDRFPAAMISGLQNQLGADWAQKLSLLSYHGTFDPERILPAVILFYLPIGIRGLLLVALLAAAMSMMNAFINMTTGFFTNDIYKNYLRPKAENKELIIASYAFGIGLVAVSFIMAYTTKNINDIWSWLMMGLAGGLIVPLALRLYWWRFNGMGFAVGTCVGVAAAVAQRFFFSSMPEWQQFVFVTGIGFIASVGGTYLAAPADIKVLKNFYLKTRPFGLWKPCKLLLSPEQLAATNREHRNDLAAIPFAFGWQVTVLLAPMLLIIGSYKSFFVTLGLLCISLAGLYIFWYRNLPAENYESCDLQEPAKTEVSVETFSSN
jgi:Na+/proline symporter